MMDEAWAAVSPSSASGTWADVGIQLSRGTAAAFQMLCWVPAPHFQAVEKREKKF